jgi:hypothetical protein
MPAPKDQPNLRLEHNVPPQGERGAVIPAWAVPDPDALVKLGAAAWTAEPVTVKLAPPGAGPDLTAQHAEAVEELAAVRSQAEQLGEAKLKAEDTAAELRKAVEKANADLAEKEAAQVAAEKELAELKAAVAKAASLKDAKEAAN